MEEASLPESVRCGVATDSVAQNVQQSVPLNQSIFKAAGSIPKLPMYFSWDVGIVPIACLLDM